MEFGDYRMPSFGNVGWICPKCGRVYAPTTPACFDCGGENEVVTSNKTETTSPNLLDIFNPNLFVTSTTKTVKKMENANDADIQKGSL